MTNYYGILYFKNKNNKVKSEKGDPGIGFKLTDDGNYDIENKRLVNVDNPLKENDVVNKKFHSNELEKAINQRKVDCEKLINSLKHEISSISENIINFDKNNKNLINSLNGEMSELKTKQEILAKDFEEIANKQHSDYSTFNNQIKKIENNINDLKNILDSKNLIHNNFKQLMNDQLSSLTTRINGLEKNFLNNNFFFSFKDNISLSSSSLPKDHKILKVFHGEKIVDSKIFYNKENNSDYTIFQHNLLLFGEQNQTLTFSLKTLESDKDEIIYRTDLDYNLKNNIKPVNRVDEACKQHDIRYSSNIPRREADQILLDDINDINNPTFKEFYAIIIIKIVFFFKLKFCNYL
ncbi:uncharacterized protein B4U80_08866 [Leptotrombidium deliense]|uniref:Phospholipase A2-like domain-containing protein n=1 Tax=Leptotrombidium deliense TaxID=299467 RepID=A0A443S6G4_9ACAR|nr:uncharacterized protein B4U80_08866 [Leptotrombidium deliense]